MRDCKVFEISLQMGICFKITALRKGNIYICGSRLLFRDLTNKQKMCPPFFSAFVDVLVNKGRNYHD